MRSNRVGWAKNAAGMGNSKTLKGKYERDHLRDPCVYDRIILKWFFYRLLNTNSSE
jgi:hypothetical protein